MIPFMGALEFFLGFYSCLPDPVQKFILFVFGCFICAAFVKVVFHL